VSNDASATQPLPHDVLSFCLPIHLSYLKMLSSHLSQLPRTPRTPRHSHFITRDDRIRVHALANAGLTHSLISAQLNLSVRQVEYSVGVPPTPKKRSGRPRLLNPEQVQELIQFVRSSRATRQMSWQALAAHFSEWGVSEYPIPGR
jgi:MoxR-like ATPase